MGLWAFWLTLLLSSYSIAVLLACAEVPVYHVQELTSFIPIGNFSIRREIDASHSNALACIIWSSLVNDANVLQAIDDRGHSGLAIASS